MAQKAIETILMRQLASYLAMPVFLVDTAGTLIFYNGPAEEVLGLRFDETGEMPVEKWTSIFTPTGEDGAPLPPDALPLVIANTERRPSHRRFGINGLDGVRREIEVTAFPLLGQEGRHLGAVALFWEVPAP